MAWYRVRRRCLVRRQTRTVPPERTQRHLPQICRPTYRRRQSVLRIRHTRRTRGETLSDSQLPIRCLHTNVDEQLSGTARRRSKPTHSQRRKICSPHQDRTQRRDCRQRHNTWRSTYQLDNTRRQSPLEISRRAADVPSGKYRRRSSDGDYSRHTRRRVAAIGSAARIAIPLLRLAGYYAAVCTSTVTAQARRQGQTQQTRRRQARFPRLPTRLDRPHYRREDIGLSRSRIFPRSRHKFSGSVGVELRHRTRDFLQRRAYRSLFARALFAVGSTVRLRKGQVVQPQISADQAYRRVGKVRNAVFCG